jgi:putative transport protein
LITYLQATAFANRDFHELPDGEVRLSHPLTSHLAHTAALWRKASEPIAEWLARSFHRASETLRSYPEIAILLSLAFGYYFGSFTYKGLALGAVTATLIAAVIIGQLDIPVSGPLKPFFFLMFLFAIGYAVGPQFVRGVASDGLPQALYAVVVCVFCLIAAYLAARLAGYNAGSAAGLYAGSQTISASMGLG